VERVLRAYAGIGSPYQGDEVKKDAKQAYRSCIEPNVGTFLQRLAGGNNKTKTLLTTRLCPKELDDIAGCFCKELRKLNKEDAVEFVERQGVKGTRAEIERVSEPYGYHPLSLRLLSGMIVKDPEFKGDIVGWTECNPFPELKGEKRKHHILELSYNSLDQQKQKLISKIAAFRNPMNYESISIFNEFESKEKFKEALTELVERGILFSDDKTNKYDLHPIVRRYCYDRLLEKTGVHSQLRDYFAKVPPKEKIESLDDLAPVIELYHHTVKSRKYEEAFDLFHDRIGELTYFQFGAYNLEIELLRALFPDGEEKPPKLKTESAQASTLNDLANSYSFAGQPRKAVPLFMVANEMTEKLGNIENLATGLGNLAYMCQIPLGELKSAESNLLRSVELFQETKHEFGEAIGHNELGRLLAYQGRFQKSEKEFAEALELFIKKNTQQSKGLVWAYRSLHALLLSDEKKALYSAKKAKKLADVDKFERNIIRAEWLLGASYLLKKDFHQAEKHLSEALVRDRRINLVDLEPDILLELAKLRFAKNNKKEALKLAEEALGIANRCEYRLKQADVHNFLGEFYLDEKDFAEAKKHIEKAKEKAECGYQPAMNKAVELEKRLKK
jgi:tetratricopeptide (TPR) repeat protein